MNVNYHLIGARIQEIRISKNLSQSDLAELTKLSISYISMLENGKRRASIESLVMIADSLEVTVDELLNGNQLYNPTEYQTDLDLLMADCDRFEKRCIYEFAKAGKDILRNNRKFLKP